MTSKKPLSIGIAAAAGLLLLAAGFALGREAAPADYRGVEEQVLAAIDLEGEVRSLDNRELRLSRASVAPDGHIGVHSHQGDPTIVYVLQGSLINHHSDGTTTVYRAGDAFAEFGPRSHWVENRGKTPAVFIAANLHRR